LAACNVFSPSSFVGGSSGLAPRGINVARYGNMLSVPGDIKNGKKVMFDGVPMEILSFQGKKVGKGVGIVKAKVKILTTGALVEKTLKSGQKLEEVETFWKDASFSWSDGDNYAFMDTETFEEMTVSKDLLGESAEWVQDGMVVELEQMEGNIVSFRMKEDLIETIEKVPEQATGNSIIVELSNGLSRSGPSYLKVGDKVKINKSDYQISGRV